jgi:RNA exonuclease 1
MFSSKGLFSEVTCPYQSTCQLPRCLFWHPDSAAQATPSIVNSEEIDLGEDEDRPRKRQKVDENQKSNGDGRTTFREKAEALGKKDPKALSAPTANGRGQRRILDPDRPISPPPLRRKSQLPVVQNGSSSTPIKTLTPAVTFAPVTPKVVAKTPVKAPLKQESLNPRVLKGPAPSTHAIRYKLVQMLHTEFARLNSELKNDANDEEEKLLLSDRELITKALDLEENAAAEPSIYSNIVKGKIGLYKKMNVQQWKEERAKEVTQQKAAEATGLSDTPVAKPQEPPKVVVTGLRTEEELKILPRLFTSITGLAKHGYVTSVPTDSEIESAKKGIEAAQGWEVCDRCKSRFQVFPGRREEDGVLASGGTCTYHWGKPYMPERSAMDPKGKRERRYKCCNELMGDSSGCTKADCHVFKISEVKRMASVLNFEETPENTEKVCTQPVCIDGEMGYTVYGLELIRLTATSWPNGEELFDVLVRPFGEVMDLNSRFSGVWPNDYAEATAWDAPPPPYTPLPPPPPRDTLSPNPKLAPAPPKRQLRIVSSPAAARALLFSYLSPRTPLIGHGLENDLNATRVIHPTIIDTVLLYPHKAGLPYRNGLKALMYQHLNKHIQVVVNGKMEGHDSMEDANAAGELVRFALANEWTKMKRDGWTLEEGKFNPPAPKVPASTPIGPKTQVLGNGQMITFAAGRKRSRDVAELVDGELNY